MAKSLVIIGNGMVTGRFLDELLSLTHHYQITVISGEAFGSYNRIMLSTVLAGETTVDKIIQKTAEWYKQHSIQFINGERAKSIDRLSKTVVTETGRVVSYDELVIATGSRSSTISAKNLHLNHIFPFRTILNTEAMLKRLPSVESVVVVGGGLLGLEAAYGLAKRGAEMGVTVSLIHRSPWLLNRQLDKDSAWMLKSIMENMGIKFYLKDEVDSFLGNTELEGAKLKSGEVLTCQMAVIATGITPNAELGFESGLKGNRAIEVDDGMQTSDENISALGECVEHRGDTFGLVDPLWRQAKTLAMRLSGTSFEPFVNSPIATKLKVSGVQVFSAGQVQSTAQQEQIIVKDAASHVYRKLIVEDGCLKGIVLFGDVRSGAHYFDLMQNGINVEKQLPQLIFGQEFIS